MVEPDNDLMHELDENETSAVLNMSTGLSKQIYVQNPEIIPGRLQPKLSKSLTLY
jgi:hypothetical protein